MIMARFYQTVKSHIFTLRVHFMLLYEQLGISCIWKHLCFLEMPFKDFTLEIVFIVWIFSIVRLVTKCFATVLALQFRHFPALLWKICFCPVDGSHHMWPWPVVWRKSHFGLCSATLNTTTWEFWMIHLHYVNDRTYLLLPLEPLVYIYTYLSSTGWIFVPLKVWIAQTEL